MEATLSAEQLERLKRLRALSRLMDEAIAIPGTTIRLGIDSIVGLIPVLGDTITTAISAYIIREAALLGAPRTLVTKMIVNVTIDFVAGSIPLVGDVFDVAWKANKKNLQLLETWLSKHELAKEDAIDV